MSTKTDPKNRRIRGKALRNRREPRLKTPSRPLLYSAHRDEALSGDRDAPQIPRSASLPSAGDTDKPVAVVSEPAENTNPDSVTQTSVPQKELIKKSGRLFWFSQAGILAALVILGLLFYSGRKNASLTLTYLVPGEDEVTETYLYGETASLWDPVPVKGKTFLCWEDSRGRAESREQFPVYSSRTLTARYLPALEADEHIAYLDTGEAGLLNPGGSVTVRDLVLVLYRLLNTNEAGNGKFLDVPKDDPCYQAAGYLKDLGILTGKRLHPSEKLTRGELLKILCGFYPQSTDHFIFSDLDETDSRYPIFCTAAANGWIASGSLVRADADAPLSRGSFARIMNRLLHRNEPRHLSGEQTGTMLDMVPSGEFYDDMVEASIPHSYRIEDGEEIWTDSEPLPMHEPGFFFSGVRLHCISEDGNPVVNGNLGGLSFNVSGEITTGDLELDARLWEILENTIDPDSMTREEMLRAVYDHVVANYTYIYGRMYAFGAEGWAVKEANRMLRDHGGNCYCYAALFYELARFVGYDAVLYSGRVSGEQYEFQDYEGNIVYAGEMSTPHAWVEIELEGENYLFDAEYEYRSYGANQMFKCTEDVWQRFGYSKPKTETVPAKETAP